MFESIELKPNTVEHKVCYYIFRTEQDETRTYKSIIAYHRDYHVLRGSVES